MKLQGKIPSKKNDYDKMNDMLSDGLLKLDALKDSSKLSDTQKKAILDVMSKVSVLQFALTDCSKIDKFESSEIKQQAIADVVTKYNIMEMPGFDDVSQVFGHDTSTRVMSQDRYTEIAGYVDSLQQTESRDHSLV